MPTEKKSQTRNTKPKTTSKRNTGSLNGSVKVEDAIEAVALAHKGAQRQVAPVAEKPSRWLNPTQLEWPAFVMSFPFSYDTAVPNNPWMTDLKEDERQPDYQSAAVQFLQLYKYISAEALVYIVPGDARLGLQDLVYTANLGIVLEHVPGDENTVIVSNYTSAPRRGETEVGVKFFESMGYKVAVPPTKFEGEAELKHLHDNIYVGGYGIRSEKETYDWMERNYDMRIIKVGMSDPYLCHLDGLIFPITSQDTLVCTKMFTRKEVSALEKVTNIISVTPDESYSGICNCVRLPHVVLNSTYILDLKSGTKEYREELQKNRRLEDIAADLALEVAYFNLSEFYKSGALLSCMVMHLNRQSYRIALTS